MKLTDKIMDALMALLSDSSNRHRVIHAVDRDATRAAIDKVLAAQPETRALPVEVLDDALSHIGLEDRIRVKSKVVRFIDHRPTPEPAAPYSEAFARKMAGPAPTEPPAPVSNPVPGTSAFPNSEARDNDFDVPQAVPTNVHPDDAAVVEVMKRTCPISCRRQGDHGHSYTCLVEHVTAALAVARRGMEEKILKYEEIFAKIWGLAMTDCGPENYELFPEMLAQYSRGMHTTEAVLNELEAIRNEEGSRRMPTWYGSKGDFMRDIIDVLRDKLTASPKPKLTKAEQGLRD
jgi:hypothetical protein